MSRTTIRRLASTLVAVSVIAVLPGCDEYEREQLRQAGDDIDSASQHVGEASSSALERTRTGTGNAVQNLGEQINDPNQQVEDEPDQNKSD